jgi:hypothetical protein
MLTSKQAIKETCLWPCDARLWSTTYSSVSKAFPSFFFLVLVLALWKKAFYSIETEMTKELFTSISEKECISKPQGIQKLSRDKGLG